MRPKSRKPNSMSPSTLAAAMPRTAASFPKAQAPEDLRAARRPPTSTGRSQRVATASRACLKFAFVPARSSPPNTARRRSKRSPSASKCIACRSKTRPVGQSCGRSLRRTATTANRWSTSGQETSTSGQRSIIPSGQPTAAGRPPAIAARRPPANPRGGHAGGAGSHQHGHRRAGV